MKRTKLRKKSKQSVPTLERKLWTLCKQIIRKKYKPDCYTCHQTELSGSNLHTGHVPWPKAVLGAYLKYDLRLLRPQCYNCNINRGGMGAEAYKRMLKEIGKARMNKLERDRQIIVKAHDHYLQLIEKYTNELDTTTK